MPVNVCPASDECTLQGHCEKIGKSASNVLRLEVSWKKCFSMTRENWRHGEFVFGYITGCQFRVTTKKRCGVSAW